MTGHPLSRQLAHTTVDGLKKAGHIVLAPGGSEQVVRDLTTLIDPVLLKVLTKIDRSPIMGEVSSTFGDEATDEAVEELVSAMREALLDSDGVEDVFAEDRIIERLIFRTFADTLRTVGTREEEEEEERPPISVRLDTLGYVAAAAAKSADDDTLREALDRAAEAAQSELKTFDEDTRTAFFRPVDPDPERRLDIEAAIEEELSDLVDLGVVELPTVRRAIDLSSVPDGKRRALRKKLDELTHKHLQAAVCPGSWDWSPDKRSVLIVFTPLTEPDDKVIERAAEAFEAELRAAIATMEDDPPMSVGPKSAVPASGSAAAPASTPKPEARDVDADVAFAMKILRATEGARAKPAASGPSSSKPAPRTASSAASGAPSAASAPATSGEEPKPKTAKKAATKAATKKPTKKKDA